MQPSEKLLFTRAEAAEMLSISMATLDVAIARGMLRSRRMGRRVMLEKRKLEAFSRSDHPRIWAANGGRGTSIAGRECWDCEKQGRKGVPAIRFFSKLPLCADCWQERSASTRASVGSSPSRLTAAVHAEALAEAE
jgi:excisionase family DNA binding protein